MSWTSLKSKTSELLRDTVGRMRRQAQTGRKPLQKTCLKEGLWSKTCKELLKLNSKKRKKERKKLFSKDAKDLNRHLNKENIHMANKPMKRHSTSHVTRELQVKAAMRCHHVPNRMATTHRMLPRTWSSRNCPLLLAGRARWHSYSRRWFGGIL